MQGFISFGKRVELQLNQERPYLLRCLRGEEACDYRIRGGRVYNSFTGELKDWDLWVAHGFIVYAGVERPEGEMSPFEEPMKAREEIDAAGFLVLPGLVDSHMHVESTMLSPHQLGKVLARTGTTTIITDPHEMVNVAGEEGLRYMLDNSESSPVRQIILVPSCVPAAPSLENAGADWDASVIGKVLDWGHPRIAGLAEAMSYLDIIHSRPRMEGIMNAALSRGAFIQGHCMGLRGRSLAAYALAGAETNHENLSDEDIYACMETGIQVDIRLTSSLMERQVGLMVEGAKRGRYRDGISSCTDDVHIKDILTLGHVNLTLRRLIDNGVTPEDAIRSATLNSWRTFGVRHAGALAAGYLADIQLLPLGKKGDEYAGIGKNPSTVLVGGKIILQEGKLQGNPAVPEGTLSFERKNTINVPKLALEAFQVRPPKEGMEKAKLRTISYPEGGKANFPGEVTLPLRDGVLSIADTPNLVWIRVFNRYGKGTVGTGLVEGYPLKQGAIATSVSHDSHNITVLYREEGAAMKAVNALIDSGGGMAYVDGAGKLTLLPLPVGGLLSAAEPPEVASQVEELDRAYREANGPKALMMNAVVMALPVVPSLRVTDLGIVDVLKQELIPLFLD